MTTKGRLAANGEKCVMQQYGFWVAAGGRKVTAWIRVDKPDNKQYSMDRHHNFYVETIG